MAERVATPCINSGFSKKTTMFKGGGGDELLVTNSYFHVTATDHLITVDKNVTQLYTMYCP